MFSSRVWIYSGLKGRGVKCADTAFPSCQSGLIFVVLESCLPIERFKPPEE